MKKTSALLLSLCMVVLSIFSIYNGAASEPDNRIKTATYNINNVQNYPRPYIDEENVPLRTSIYTRLYIDGNDGTDTIDINSVEVQLIPEGGSGFYLLKKNKVYSDGYTGEFIAENDEKFGKVLNIYVDSENKLAPGTNYTVKVDAKTAKGYGITEQASTWSFTTEFNEEYDVKRTVDFSLNADVKWKGRHSNGINRTSSPYGPEYVKRLDYIFSEEMQAKYPNAFDLCRYKVSPTDIFNTSIIEDCSPNFVREKETRRIKSVTEVQGGVELHVEHFYGYEQYGISNTPLSEDYDIGDEILIGDSKNNQVAKVLSINDSENKIKVSEFVQPVGGWDIDYWKTLPTKEDPSAPGLFPRGGTYLYKFKPSGTPMYYWNRLDTVLDMYVVKYGQRMLINIRDSYGDLSIDGRNANHPKDYAEFHQVTYDLMIHLIERYGDKTTTWVYSFLNEPDLMNLYWVSRDWIELQKFYDYGTDAVLKAFEDKGYDSNEIMVGGLELGAIQGTDIRVHDFLAHCSPTAKGNNILEYNAAYADEKLDGKRSKRVEDICAANNGKGTPVDFLSVHTYNASKVAAEKLITAKEAALQIDPEFYEKLWISSFESVPSWNGFFDPGFSEWTLGNGYFPTWTADFFSRLLNKSLEDSRYAYGESVFTLWGFPQEMWKYLNDIVIKVNHIDGRQTTSSILPKPILHYLALISTMKTDYWVITQETLGGHNVSGFAAEGDDDLRMVLYSHNGEDPQSRSNAQFDFELDLKGLKWKNVKVTEYRFDKANNTYYPFALDKKDKKILSNKEFDTLKELTELKVSKEEVYAVGNDGSINISLPVAANGLNFVVLSDGDKVETPPDETPVPTGTPESPEPSETPQSPIPTDSPDTTKTPDPTESPSESTITPAETPDKTSDETPVVTPTQTDMSETPNQSKDDDEPNKAPKTGDVGNGITLILMGLSGMLLMIRRKLAINKG